MHTPTREWQTDRDGLMSPPSTTTRMSGAPKLDLRGGGGHALDATAG